MTIAILFALWNASGAGPSPSVTCRVPNDPEQRVYRLEARRPGDREVWDLSMQRRESRDKWIRLTLPGATVSITAGRARLAFKSANGGRQVDLDVGPSNATLEVYVEHGLEVNVEPDLDPDVDHLNTNGRLTTLQCTIVE
jgi:hypothetical protein